MAIQRSDAHAGNSPNGCNRATATAGHSRAAKVALGAATLAIALAGCSSIDQIPLPKTQLPPKAESTAVKCDRLTEAEKTQCLTMAKEVRRVCHKVERNARICEADKEWIERLYTEIDKS